MEEYKIIVEKTVRDLFKSTNLQHIKNYRKSKENEISKLDEETKQLVLQKYSLLVNNISSVKSIYTNLHELDKIKEGINEKLKRTKLSADIIDKIENPKDLIIDLAENFQNDFNQKFREYSSFDKNDYLSVNITSNYFILSKQNSYFQFEIENNDNKLTYLESILNCNITNKILETKLIEMIENLRIEYNEEQFMKILCFLLNAKINKEFNKPTIGERKEEVIISELLDCFYKNILSSHHVLNENAICSENISFYFKVLYYFNLVIGERTHLYYESEFYQTLISDETTMNLYYDIFEELEKLEEKNSNFLSSILTTVKLKIKIILVLFQKQVTDLDLKKMILVFFRSMLFKELFKENNQNYEKEYILINRKSECGSITLDKISTALSKSMEPFLNYFKSLINKESIETIMKSPEFSSKLESNQLNAFKEILSITYEMKQKFSVDNDSNTLVLNSIYSHLNSLAQEIILIKHTKLINTYFGNSNDKNIDKKLFNKANLFKVNNIEMDLFNFYTIIISLTLDNSTEDKDIWRNVYSEIKLVLFSLIEEDFHKKNNKILNSNKEFYLKVFKIYEHILKSDVIERLQRINNKILEVTVTNELIQIEEIVENLSDYISTENCMSYDSNDIGLSKSLIETMILIGKNSLIDNNQLDNEKIKIKIFEFISNQYMKLFNEKNMGFIQLEEINNLNLLFDLKILSLIQQKMNVSIIQINEKIKSKIEDEFKFESISEYLSLKQTCNKVYNIQIIEEFFCSKKNNLKNLNCFISSQDDLLSKYKQSFCLYKSSFTTGNDNYSLKHLVLNTSGNINLKNYLVAKSVDYLNPVAFTQQSESKKYDSIKLLDCRIDDNYQSILRSSAKLNS